MMRRNGPDDTGAATEVSPYLLRPLRSREEALADIELEKLRQALRRWHVSLGLSVPSRPPSS